MRKEPSRPLARTHTHTHQPPSITFVLLILRPRANPFHSWDCVCVCVCASEGPMGGEWGSLAFDVKIIYWYAADGHWWKSGKRLQKYTCLCNCFFKTELSLVYSTVQLWCCVYHSSLRMVTTIIKRFGLWYDASFDSFEIICKIKDVWQFYSFKIWKCEKQQFHKRGSHSETHSEINLNHHQTTNLPASWSYCRFFLVEHEWCYFLRRGLNCDTPVKLPWRSYQRLMFIWMLFELFKALGKITVPWVELCLIDELMNHIAFTKTYYFTHTVKLKFKLPGTETLSYIHTCLF